MTKVKFDISTSLDGFIAGPNSGFDNGLGDGGERLHEWGVRLKSWRERHGKEGGEEGRDAEIMEEHLGGVGAVVMGRRMFGGPPDSGEWGDDPGDGFWGDDPPFKVPVFVVTHHPREDLEMQGGTTFHFVTDGPEAALERARHAAGDGDVSIAGGASVIQQLFAAGLVDEFQLHVVPVMLGEGIRLFDSLAGRVPEVEQTRVVESPVVTHVSYRVVR